MRMRVVMEQSMNPVPETIMFIRVHIIGINGCESVTLIEDHVQQHCRIPGRQRDGNILWIDRITRMFPWLTYHRQIPRRVKQMHPKEHRNGVSTFQWQKQSDLDPGCSKIRSDAYRDPPSFGF